MQALERILTQAVLAAGERALSLSRASPRRWLKPDGTPVTEADIAADEILRAHLGTALQGAGWQSEESAPACPAEESFWIVDPIDGTSEYAAKGPGWCVAAALIHHGEPVLAAIYAPVNERLFTAAKGEGAKLNGKPIRVSETGLAGARLLANASNARRFPEAEVRSLHAIALRLCAVAEAAHDGMFAVGPKQDWDIAAGDLIVREAGGRVSDLGGTPLVYGRPGQRRSGVIAGGPVLHQEIIARTRGA